MAPQTLVKLTYEDYAAIPNDGRRHEIIDGEHYVNPAPNLRHQTLSMRLTIAVGSFVEQHALGQTFHPRIDVVLSEHVVVEPDFVFVSNARAHILESLNIQGAPDLVVEILSSNPEYDERVKYQIYEMHGVREYWIVDPAEEIVKIYHLENGRYRGTDIGDAITTPLLPGFSLRLRDLFA
jgi:Uma2 family endonuclease